VFQSSSQGEPCQIPQLQLIASARIAIIKASPAEIRISMRKHYSVPPARQAMKNRVLCVTGVDDHSCSGRSGSERLSSFAEDESLANTMPSSLLFFTAFVGLHMIRRTDIIGS
jgi:hypothetical protein